MWGRHKCEFFASIVVATAATLGHLAAQGAPPQVLRMVIQSDASAGQKCLDVPGAQFIAGVRLQTLDCNNQSDETFEYDQSLQRLVIGHLCVEAWGRGDAGDAVGLAACNGAPNQHWSLAASGDHYLILGANNRCLEIKAGVKDNGAPLDAGICQQGNASQLWTLLQPANPQAAACSHVAIRLFADLCNNCTKPPFEIDARRTSGDAWVTLSVNGNAQPGTGNWRAVSESSSELLLYDQSRDLFSKFDLFGRKGYFRKGNTGDWIPASEIIRSDC